MWKSNWVDCVKHKYELYDILMLHIVGESKVKQEPL